MSFLLALLLLFTPIAHAQTATSTSDTQSQVDSTTQQEIDSLQNEIAQLQIQLNNTTAQKNTLQTALTAINLNVQKTQKSITLTNAQITQADKQITQLSGGIATTTATIATTQDGVASSLRDLAEHDDEPITEVLLAGGTLSDFFDEAVTLGTLRDTLENKIEDLSSLKTNLQTNKNTAQQSRARLAALETQLAQQQLTLKQTQASKAQLLQETNSQESTYEALIAQAKAQLQGFSTFAQNATSKGILYNQTSCDAWGCYYNQRDSEWGNDALDGSQYTMKSDGCLVTSMAMIMTHYGYSNVTPVTINDNPADFAAYYPADLLVNNVPIGGATVTRVSIGTKQANIDAVLATGNPVVVGIHAYGGTHYIVFTSGSKGKYIMRDPYQPDAKDIPFTQYYSLSDIFYAAKVAISK